MNDDLTFAQAILATREAASRADGFAAAGAIPEALAALGDAGDCLRAARRALVVARHLAERQAKRDASTGQMALD